MTPLLLSLLSLCSKRRSGDGRPGQSVDGQREDARDQTTCPPDTLPGDWSSGRQAVARMKSDATQEGCKDDQVSVLVVLILISFAGSSCLLTGREEEEERGCGKEGGDERETD